MRLKHSKFLTFSIIVINVFFVYYTWKLFIATDQNTTSNSSQEAAAAAIDLANAAAAATTPTEKPKPKDRIQTANKHIKKLVTIVFRDFYHFENDLRASIDSILALIPTIQILVVYDDEPYPPLDHITNYTIKNNLKFLNLGFDVKKSLKSMSPLFHIKTKYALLMPDSVRLGGRQIVQKMLKELGNNEDAIKPSMNKDGKNEKVDSAGDKQTNQKRSKKMLATPFASSRVILNCCKLKLDLANWTLEYNVKNGSDDCDMVCFVFFE